MYKKVDQCRVCGNRELVCVLDLGMQMLTGVFPKTRDESITTGPLRLVKCHGGDGTCGLLQMEHSYDLGEMYGDNYGYRSGLNASMVEHLNAKVKRICEHRPLAEGDLVIDIGSNDCTTLRAYPDSGPILVGIDPTGSKFRKHYPKHVQLIPDFFSADLVAERFPGKKARVVSSFSMFYDLEAPLTFMEGIHSILADDGIWVFEQSYMPRMLETNSYDTVCHEHLEFYALRQIKWMTDHVGFTIIDVEFNEVNGGSFSVTVAKNTGPSVEEAAVVSSILKRELDVGLDELYPFENFADRVEQSRDELLKFIGQARSEGKTVAALGASTKGNVLLQYCSLSERDIAFIGEINSEKYGCYTPGSWIPIIPEEELIDKNPDFVLILPWHFKHFFEASKKLSGLRKIYPLPKLHVD
ncbi:MAG: methyltransferase [Gammaproteobacteria bacterium]|nr:MAG: methyltransferase [Gammaproteobacteria bacterium]